MRTYTVTEYEKEIAEMFIKAFEESEDEDVVKITKGITL